MTALSYIVSLVCLAFAMALAQCACGWEAVILRKIGSQSFALHAGLSIVS